MIKGFTLVELVIVIIIVGILSIVAVPIYRSYFRKAMTTEGKSLLGVIQMSERAYFAENAKYLGVETTGFNEILDIDVRPNKYFKTFSILSNDETGDSARYTAFTTGTGNASGISLSIIGQPKGEMSFNDEGINA